MGPTGSMKSSQANSSALSRNWFTGLRLATAFTVTILAMVGAGIWFYYCQYQSLRQDTEANLQTIAQSKVDQIVQWRNERLADACLLMESAFFQEEVMKWLPHPDPATTEGLLSRFRAER